MKYDECVFKTYYNVLCCARYVNTNEPTLSPLETVPSDNGHMWFQGVCVWELF